jgi:hypothetical protein
MSKKYPPEAYRDWPNHSDKLIAVVDQVALMLSPAWTPEKQRRRWVWRRAFYLHHQLGELCGGYRANMTFSPTQPIPGQS